MKVKDRDLALKCVRAYNDWMVDSWCASAPGRYIPMIIIPLWDPEASAAEIERNAAKGAKAIAFSENPAKLGLPSIHSVTRVLGSGVRRGRRNWHGAMHPHRIVIGNAQYF